MLTADLVDARRKDGELLLRPLEDRDGAVGIAAEYLGIARELVGRRREELEEAWGAAAADAPGKLIKVAAGLKKLASDACVFEAEIGLDPAALRQKLFTRAAARRRAATFVRSDVIAETAAELGLEPEGVERGLFSDLRSEHVLRSAPLENAESLVDTWELGQAQAVLLTAVRITCEIGASSPGLVRAFFAKLKFHRLLFSAERIETDEGAGYRVVVDGPYSLFDSVTKYGLKLALLLPALRMLERWSLVADIRWGKTRDPLTFRLASANCGAPHAEGEVHLADEVAELARAIDDLDDGWRAKPATAVLDVPGLGVCIPDLELVRRGSKKAVYVEVLGYWSRDAVFRRVELAERGLGERIVFAVSSRLRVSAEVLPESLPASLYVYKGKMSPRAVVGHAAAIAGRAPAKAPSKRKE